MAPRKKASIKKRTMVRCLPETIADLEKLQMAEVMAGGEKRPFGKFIAVAVAKEYKKALEQLFNA